MVSEQRSRDPQVLLHGLHTFRAALPGEWRRPGEALPVWCLLAVYLSPGQVPNSERSTALGAGRLGGLRVGSLVTGAQE